MNTVVLGCVVSPPPCCASLWLRARLQTPRRLAFVATERNSLSNNTPQKQPRLRPAHLQTADAAYVSQPAPAYSEANELARLRAENEALRLKLAEVQGVEPWDVDFDFDWPGSDITTAEVAVAGAGAVVEVGALTEGIRWPQPSEQPPFWERPARKGAPSLLGPSGPRYEQKDPRQLHVVHATAEMAPCAKVGGLGDVVTGLARAAMSRGHLVEVIMPFYECIPDDGVQDLSYECEFDCPKGYMWDGDMRLGTLKTYVFRGLIDGVPVFLLRPDWDVVNIFRGGRIYGGSYNEVEAYLYFSRACLEFLKVTGREPHVIHCHEWQTSAVPMLYWDVYHKNGLWKPQLMLTIHNFDNPGEVRQEEFTVTGIPGELFADVDKALDERTIGHNPERLSLLKGGIIYSNAVTTVSPTYAREALQGGAAGWLRTTLARDDIQAKFHGVLNGIDTLMWDPSNDPLLPAPYNAQQLQGKAVCKTYLQEGLGLEVTASKPVVVCITRLVPQKGVHLIRHALHRTLEKGGQFVLLGSGHSDGDFKRMAEQEFKNHPDVRLLVMYSEKLAHLLYAAADMVLVPSLFEPCGLTQLIAMRYGAVPVVRSTGGLADTVKDVDGGGAAGNGFAFDGTDEGSLNGALDRGLAYFQSKPDWWEALVKKNMQVDHSWGKSCQQYLQLYATMASC